MVDRGKQVRGSPVYLDQAATSFPKPDRVVAAVAQALSEGWGNPGRSGHGWAMQSQRLIDRVRRQLGQMFQADPERVILTLNGTDSLNMAIKGVVQPRDRVIAGILEHNSVRRPLERLARDQGVNVVVLGSDAEGRYDLEALRVALQHPTRLVVWTHASNVFGTIQPIAEAGRLAHEHGALFLVDAAQTAGVLPIRMEEMGIDLLATPGHKGLLGPMGTGLLVLGSEVEIKPWREGGTGGDSTEPSQPREFPTRLEAGTPNVPGLAGLSAGLEILLEEGIEQVAQREFVMADRLWDILCRADSLEPLGGYRSGKNLAVVTCRTEIWDCHELATLLDQSFDIATRAGLHCAPGAHAVAGTLEQGGIRFSAGFLNHPTDLDRLEAALQQLQMEMAP